MPISYATPQSIPGSSGPTGGVGATGPAGAAASTVLTVPVTRTNTGNSSDQVLTAAEQSAAMLVWGGTSDLNISGISWPSVAQGQTLKILNISSTKMLKIVKTNGAAGNQFLAGSDVKLAYGEGMTLVYVGTGWTELGHD